MDELEKIRKEKMEKMIAESTPKPAIKIDVTDANFEKAVIEASAKNPVVVDFWADWCVPCQMLGPVLEKLAEEYSGKFLLAKLNVDNAPKTSDKYGISGIPAVKLFKGGSVVDEFIGVRSEQDIKQWINKNLG